MAEWAAKRFWTEARIEWVEGGIWVLLDGRPIRSPAGRPLVLPTAGLAGTIAAEWDAQSDLIDPHTMPFTRTANSALDKVAPDPEAVAAHLAGYAETDLLCYRADQPQELVRRQDAAWTPLLDWAAERFGARLNVTAGVMPIAQDPAALARLTRPVRDLSPFRLAPFHDLVVLTGSFVIAFAVTEGRLDAPDAWERSRLDEEWQIGQWGRDEEAEMVAARRRRDFFDAVRFWELAQ